MSRTIGEADWRTFRQLRSGPLLIASQLLRPKRAAMPDDLERFLPGGSQARRGPILSFPTWSNANRSLQLRLPLRPILRSERFFAATIGAGSRVCLVPLSAREGGRPW